MIGLGPLNYFLSIAVSRTPSSMILPQHKNALEILERAVIGTCKSTTTSVDTKAKLGADCGPPVSDL